jgi:chromosomal replication initiator protein
MNPYYLPGLLFNQPTNKHIDKEHIEYSVSEFYQVSIEKIHTKSNKKEFVKYRHNAMYFMRQEGFTHKEISNYFGYKNHSSTIDAVNKIEGYLEYDRDLQIEFEMLRRKIYGITE